MRLRSPEIAQRVISDAIASGINHIETARGYGDCEIYVGQALAALGIPRESIHITSKILPTLSAEGAEQAIEQSLKRLGTDYLDCLALHGVNTFEHVQGMKASAGCLSAVERARKDGRVRHVGFSTHGPLEVILKAIETDRFSFVNLHYYLFFQRNAAAIALAHQKDLGVFIISPADKGGLLYTPPQRLVEACHPYSPLGLSYRFLLSDPRITTLSVGPATPKELEAPLALMHPGELTAEEAAALLQLEAQAADRLGADACRQCYQCLPCPEAIHIPEVLRLRNLAVAHDMTSYGRYRYGMFENAGHWFEGRRGSRCTDCGDCLPRCPQGLSIPHLLLDADKRLGGSDRRRLWDD